MNDNQTIKNKYYGERKTSGKKKSTSVTAEVSYYRDAKRKRRESEALFR